MFRLVSKTTTIDNLTSLVNTIHNQKDRNERNHKIQTILGGYGNALASFIVDTQHPNGNELHTITDNGIVVIQNQRTKKLITTLIARPAQIKRYYEQTIPSDIYKVISKAREHEIKGYNNW